VNRQRSDRWGRRFRLPSEANKRRGVTLIEMVIVMAIVALIVAITFPSAAAGLESIRLRSAADSVVGFLNTALTRTDRHQEPTEIIITPADRTLSMFTADPKFVKKLQLPEGIAIAGDQPRRFLLMPGGAPPSLDLDLSNTRGAHKIVRIDPVTGVPQS
jgi:prepilin-type N-terminal cleavage/methylation domain-containing protein